MAVEELWLKRGPQIRGVGAPLVIMVVGKNDEHQWWGEYFILISGGAAAHLSQRTTLNTTNIPEDMLGGYSAFMKAEIEQQVQTQLSIYLFKLFEKTNSEYALQNFDLVDAPKEDVVRLWLRGEFHDDVKKIKGTTQSETLKKFLEGVVTLPTVFAIR